MVDFVTDRVRIGGVTLSHRIWVQNNRTRSIQDSRFTGTFLPSAGSQSYCFSLEWSSWILEAQSLWSNYSLSISTSDTGYLWCVKNVWVFAPGGAIKFSMHAANHTQHVDFLASSQCVQFPRRDVCWTNGIMSPYCVCVGGEYQDPLDSNECRSCPAGRYSEDRVRLTACYSCSPGTFTPSAGYERCVSCEVGRFAQDSASTACAPCPRNGFARLTASRNCTACPVGKVTPVFGAPSRNNCSLCAQGHFGNGTACTRCPEFSFVSCPEDSKFPLVPSGIWMDPQDPLRLVSCNPKESCVETVDGLTACAIGYEGQFCSTCSHGFYKLDGYCLECPGKGKIIGIGFLVMIVLLASIFFLLRASSPYSRKINSIGIAVGWIQVIGVYSSLPIDWPVQVHTVFQIASASNLNIQLSAPECSVSMDFWTTQYLLLLSPFIFAAALLVSYGIQRIASRRYPKFPNLYLVNRKQILDLINFGAIPQTPIDISGARRYIYAFFVFLTFFYTQICSTLIKMVSCLKLEDGRYYMTNQIDLECWSESHLKRIFFPLCFFGLAYVVGIPLAFAIVFFRNRKTIFLESTMTLFGGIIGPYKVSLFWYELVNMLRKFLTVACLYTVTTSKPTLRVLLCLIVLFVFLCLQYSQNPYKLQSNNFLSFLWMIVAIFCLFSGVVFGEGDQNSSELIFAWLVVVLFAFACIYSVAAAFLEVRSYGKLQRFGKESTITGEAGRNRASGLAEFEIQHGKLQLFEEAFPGFGEKVFDSVSMMDVKAQEQFIKKLEILCRGKQGTTEPPSPQITKPAPISTIQVVAVD